MATFSGDVHLTTKMVERAIDGLRKDLKKQEEGKVQLNWKPSDDPLLVPDGLWFDAWCVLVLYNWDGPASFYGVHATGEDGMPIDPSVDNIFAYASVLRARYLHRLGLGKSSKTTDQILETLGSLVELLNSER